jgi:hypothetical protein
MTSMHLLDLLGKKGVVLLLRNGQLVARPAAKVTSELGAMIKRHKPALLAILGGNGPGPETKVYCHGEDSKPCKQEDATLWTWEGARQWYEG